MSREYVHNLIFQMHEKLNELIRNCNYDLSNEGVIKYSQTLDQIILLYEEIKQKENRCAAGRQKYANNISII